MRGCLQSVTADYRHPPIGKARQTIGTLILLTYSSLTLAVCSDYLGMENGDIPNGNIQASSVYNQFYAWKARFNGGFWAADPSDAQPWIQVDIGYQTYVSGVVTQGDGANWNWVTSLKVSTFLNSTNNAEIFVKDLDGQIMVITPFSKQNIFPGTTCIFKGGNDVRAKKK